MPERVTDWGVAAWTATAVALSNLLGWLPRLLGALVILLVGWGVASLLGRLTDRGLEAIHFDRWMSRAGIDTAIARSGMRLEPSDIVANLVKWGVFLLAILVASDAMGLPQVTAALNGVLAYIPNVIAAVLIVTFGAVLASFVGNLVKATPVRRSDLLGQVAYWAILVFAGLAALTQLNIAPALIQTLFTATLGAVALAAALAFGLGLRGAAEDLAASAELKTICHEGDVLSLSVNGQAVEGQVVMIGPGVTTLRTDTGTVMVPNRWITTQLTTIRETGAVSATPRLNVTRAPEGAVEATMNRPGQPPV